MRTPVIEHLFVLSIGQERMEKLVFTSAQRSKSRDTLHGTARVAASLQLQLPRQLQQGLARGNDGGQAA